MNSERAVQLRKRAARVVEEFTIKGFAMDDERLKRGGSVLSDRYFEEDRLFESDFDRVVAETKRLREGAAWETPRKGKDTLMPHPVQAMEIAHYLRTGDADMMATAWAGVRHE